MRNTVTALIVAMAFAANGVYAAGETGFMPWSNWRNDIWSAHDSNKDGALSMDEVKEMNHVLGEDFNGFQPWMTDHFAELDENKDGVVDQHELHMMMMKHKYTDKQMVNEWYKNLGFMVTNPANR
ncbi:MAG: hypothetical protein ACT4NU_04655 [Chromatiales bacterium]